MPFLRGSSRFDQSEKLIGAHIPLEHQNDFPPLAQRGCLRAGFDQRVGRKVDDRCSARCPQGAPHSLPGIYTGRCESINGSEIVNIRVGASQYTGWSESIYGLSGEKSTIDAQLAVRKELRIRFPVSSPNIRVGVCEYTGWS